MCSTQYVERLVCRRIALAGRAARVRRGVRCHHGRCHHVTRVRRPALHLVVADRAAATAVVVVVVVVVVVIAVTVRVTCGEEGAP